MDCSEKQDQKKELRRSIRARRPPTMYPSGNSRDDNFLIGNSYVQGLQEFGGQENDQKICGRKKYWLDDSDDYMEGIRKKQKRVVNENQVEALLEWQSSINDLPIQPQSIPNHQLSSLHLTNNLPKQHLDRFGNNIEALFININWGQKHQTLQDFRNLKLDSNKLMQKGLVFIWVEKQLLAKVLAIMEDKGFCYVQNLEVIKFDAQKIMKSSTYKSSVKKPQPQQEMERMLMGLKGINPSNLILSQPYKFFNKGKETLYLFKKNNIEKIELRHQRTCDVVFDYPIKYNDKERYSQALKLYIYSMIQTMLPKCLKLDSYNENFNLKMMELWGDKEQQRRGWINVAQI